MKVPAFARLRTSIAKTLLLRHLLSFQLPLALVGDGSPLPPIVISCWLSGDSVNGKRTLAKLTKWIINGAQPQPSAYFAWCSELKGFGCRVLPTGRRSYVADYRTTAGMRRRMVLGPHGVLTADQARDQAIAVLAEALKGSGRILPRSLVLAWRASKGC